MTEAIIALIGTVFAGFGLKFFDWLVNRKTEKRIREEKARMEDKEDKMGDLADRRQQILDLRKDLIELRKEVELKEDEMLEWREKYWTLREESVQRMVELTEALNKIKEQALQLQQALNRIKELTGNGNSETQG